MGLMDTIRQDVAAITSDPEGFGVTLTLLAPNSETAQIVGLSSMHHFSVDSDGKPVNTKNGHVTFSESVLLGENPSYPVRNPSGEVDLKKHKVTVTFSSGVPKTYFIQHFFPNESSGAIVCLLGNAS
jgi:hypothetical protein